MSSSVLTSDSENEDYNNNPMNSSFETGNEDVDIDDVLGQEYGQNLHIENGNDESEQQENAEHIILQPLESDLKYMYTVWNAIKDLDITKKGSKPYKINSTFMNNLYYLVLAYSIDSIFQEKTACSAELAIKTFVNVSENVKTYNASCGLFCNKFVPRDGN